MMLDHGSSSTRPTAAPEAEGAAGPSAALEAQLAPLRVKLLRHAQFAVHDDSLAEDLVQDTLIAVMEHYGTRRGDASLATWATAILKNKVADWYRSPTRKRMVQLTTEDEGVDDAIDALYNADGAYTEAVPAWQQPDNRTEQKQMMTVLDRCLACLPRQTGRVFMMREWLGFETAEICQRAGISADNCRMVLHRARMALRQCMQRDWIGKKVTT